MKTMKTISDNPPARNMCMIFCFLFVMFIMMY